MLKYQEQNSELTLQQGLDEFYSINTHFKELSEPEGRQGLFFQHDITHIIFGCHPPWFNQLYYFHIDFINFF